MVGKCHPWANLAYRVKLSGLFNFRLADWNFLSSIVEISYTKSKKEGHLVIVVFVFIQILVHKKYIYQIWLQLSNACQLWLKMLRIRNFCKLFRFPITIWQRFKVLYIRLSTITIAHSKHTGIFFYSVSYKLYINN